LGWALKTSFRLGRDGVSPRRSVASAREINRLGGITMNRRHPILLIAVTVLVVVGLGSPALAASDAGKRVITNAYWITGPQAFDDHGMLRNDLRDERALKSMPQTRDLNPVKSDAEAWRRALKDQAEYGTPSEKFGTDAVTPQRDDITVEECRKNWKLSSRPEGWIKNHFSYCNLSGIGFEDLACNRDGCAQIGLFVARVTLIGRAYNGLRNVEFIPTLDEVTFWGTADASTVTIRVECNGSPADSCQPGLQQVTRPAPVWERNGDATLYFFSPQDPPSPPRGEQKAFGTFKLSALYQSEVTTKTVPGPQTSVRFDSAWYLNQKQGSIFNLTSPWLSYSVRDKAVTYSAWNIYRAQNFATSTQPFLPDKKLPGATAADPLHRLYHDKMRRKANRSVAVSYCREHWAGYSELGQDCDEYPFACTYEGAAAYRFAYRQGREYNYAVQPIPSPDNQESGRRLGSWYSADRILDDDAFYVKIVDVPGIEPPTPAPRPPAGSDENIDCGDGAE